MTALTEQQKLERRRLKRQQRILQSAGNRLDKITGTAFPDRVSPSPSPSTSTSSLLPVSSSSTSSISSNRTLRSVSSVPYFQQQQQQQTLIDNDDRHLTTGIETAQHFPASNDPRRRTYDTYSRAVLEDIKSATAIPSILLPSSSSTSSAMTVEQIDIGGATSSYRQRPASSSPSFPATTTPVSAPAPPPTTQTSPIPPFSPSKQRPLSLMNTLLMRRLYRQHHHHNLDPSLKYWNVLHFISMIWLTLCCIHAEWTRTGTLHYFAHLLHDQDSSIHHFPLFRNFVTIELLLFGAFALYHPKDQYPVPDDDFALVASQLPSPLDTYMTTLLSYRRTMFCVIQDMSIVVFIIGFIQVIAKIIY